jgi:alkanesulfonate monooxygenase SsuD/methylene tetrahydromethanopterin reductase-like flavin-dependent oxidoreductase (luciferase family)
MGGSAPPAARRAARFGLGFIPSIGDPALAEAYMAECERVGRPPVFALTPEGPAVVHVAEDPDKAWAEVGPHMLHDARAYAAWQPEGGRTFVTRGPTETVDDLRAGDAYLIVTPDECVELMQRYGSVGLHPLVGGMPPELSWPSLELIVERVQPALAAAG